jgi:hypothetical protein
MRRRASAATDPTADLPSPDLILQGLVARLQFRQAFTGHYEPPSDFPFLGRSVPFDSIRFRDLSPPHFAGRKGRGGHTTSDPGDAPTRHFYGGRAATATSRFERLTQ